MPKTYETLRLLTYKTNRPLSRDEIRDHLPQKEPSLSTPWSQLSVVRMNSTFLECVDKFHGIRGTMTAVVLALAPLVFSFTGSLLLEIFNLFNASAEKVREDVLFVSLDLLMFLPFLALIIWALSVECFRYTHYPLLFNRKTRMVHVFRPNGTVLNVPWDKVYFTLGYCAVDFWEVVGHVLSEDGKMVLDTFPLSTRAIRDDSDPNTTLYQQWEFVRRYMEEGPEELIDQLSIVFPIYDKKESYGLGFKRFFTNFIHWPLAMVLFSPVLFLGTIGRWIAMRTCKIPRWPEEVVAESQIDPDDPYIRDEYHPVGTQRVEWD